jgi:small-conductance mechanosensitive channel
MARVGDMLNWLTALPPFVASALLTVLVGGGAFGLGHLLRPVLSGRLSRLTKRTRGQADDIVVEETLRRLPFWALLLGLYVATGFWRLSPHAVRGVEHALLVLALVSLTLAAVAIAGRLTVISDTTHGLALTGLTRNVVKGAIVALGLLMILNSVGVSITPILTALGVGGLAVALALQDTLSNVFAGLYVIMAGRIRVGDFIGLQSGEQGYVTDIGWRATAIAMLPNNLVLVPNSKLGQSIVTNYSLPDRELAVLVNVGVDYDSDLRRVEAVTCEVAKEVMREVPGGVATFEPFIRYNDFADSSIMFTVILRGSTFVDQYLIKHEFIKRLHERYAREGITIPFPIRTLVGRSDLARP